MNEILKDAANFCAFNENNIDEDCQIYISKFLIHPLETLAHVILTMNEYPTLMKYLKFKRRREVAKQITKAVGRGSIDLTDVNIVSQLLVFIAPVLRREKDYEEISELFFKEEQTHVAKIVWQIKSEDPSLVWDILKTFIDNFLQGGDERMRFTLPSSVFRLLALANQVAKHESDPKAFKKIFELARRLIEKMGSLQSVLAIKLYLELILTINKIDTEKYFDEYTYETASECLLLYEAQISDSTTKQVILELIINSCLVLHCLSDENYDILLSNITSYCSKILKKNEQCQILLSCCYLFTNPQADSNRIHEILKRCAKLANTCVNQSITNMGLFFQILDNYLFFVKQKQVIEDKDEAIPQIIEMIEAKLAEDQDGEENQKCQIELKEKWAQISVKYKSS